MKKSKTPLKEQLLRFVRLLRVIANQFRVFIVCSLFAFALSTWILYTVYPRHELPPHHHSLLGIAYDTLQMIFFETPIPFVDDWRLIPLFFGLPLLGLVVIAEGVVSLGNLLVQRRLHSKEWQEMLAATYTNHVVVCGLGNVGFRVVQHLKRIGESVVCIESNEQSSFIAEMEKYDVPVLIGDIRNQQVLVNASVKKAKAVIAVTDNDLANLEAALTARELHPGIKIVIRMFDQRLAKMIEKSFDINCAFSTSALAAPLFAQTALGGNVLASFEFANTVVNAFEMTLPAGSPLLNLTVDKLREQYEVTVLMYERNGKADWNPAPDVVLQENDRLLIMGDGTGKFAAIADSTKTASKSQPTVKA